MGWKLRRPARLWFWCSSWKRPWHWLSFLKDILYSVRNVKCLLISKTIKGDCKTVPFCLGNKGSNMLFSADLKYSSQLSESCITCPFTSLAALLAPYFPLRRRPVPLHPFLHKRAGDIPPPPLHNMEIKELTNLGFLEITLFSSVTTQPTMDLIPLTDMRVLGQKHSFSETNFPHFSPSPVNDL